MIALGLKDSVLVSGVPWGPRDPVPGGQGPREIGKARDTKDWGPRVGDPGTTVFSPEVTY